MSRLHRELARNHALRRLWQRFGIAFGLPDLARLEQRIRAGGAVWVRDLRGPRQAYRLQVRGRPICAVFDIALDCIVTFLPVGWRLR